MESPTRSTGDSTFPAYSIAIAELLASQFTRFITLNPHQLAGHVANLEFWSDEVAHCLEVLDQYNERFDRLAAAQREYVARKQTVEFDLSDKWRDSAQAATRPQRVSDRERLAARTALCEAFYGLICCCCRAGLIDESAARRHCDRHSISVDPNDLHR